MSDFSAICFVLGVIFAFLSGWFARKTYEEATRIRTKPNPMFHRDWK